MVVAEIIIAAAVARADRALDPVLDRPTRTSSIEAADVIITMVVVIAIIAKLTAAMTIAVVGVDAALVFPQVHQQQLHHH